MTRVLMCIAAITAVTAFVDDVEALWAQELPVGVTQAMVSEGKQLFAGAGICFACHGQNAKGMPGVGPNLTDKEWLHTDGSFRRIAEVVLKGVPAEETKSGVIMPPKGGVDLTKQQIDAVAAYVWTLSRQ